nr:hypothetical protein [Tanacetum cinerariifolium]
LTHLEVERIVLNLPKQQRVFDLETIKTTQAMEIKSLKRRVKNLERRKRSRTHGLNRLYKVRLSERVQSSEDEGLDDKYVKKEIDAAQIQVTTATTTPTISIDEATLAQALTELKNAKPKAKAKGIIFHEPEESTTTTAIPKSKSQDKGKAKMIEEPLKLKKKDQIQLDEEVPLKEQKKKMNKPPTQAQQRKIMCTYLKNMEGKKLTDLKNKSFDSIQKMFDRAFTRKIDDDKETSELHQLVKIIPDEEGVAIDAIPLAVKPPSIIDWKI